jgi:hypothetical protein
MADDDDEQNPDAGSTHLKNFMSETQPSIDPGGFGNAPRRKLVNATDGALEQHYGKEVDESPDDGPDPAVNRSRKGAKSPGSVGNSRDKPIKVLR